MALFKRKKKESVLPEVDKYYEAERRDRTGLAWVLAFVSIILVALFIIIMFLAGRWAFRAVFNDDQEVAVTEEATQKDTPSFDGGDSNSTDSNSDSTSKEESGSSEPQEDQSAESEGTVDAPATTETPNPVAPTVPATGDDPLPSTGPESVITLFMGTSAIAGGTHYIVSRKRKK